MGKGSGRYKDRQQCSDKVMQLRWELAFGCLSPEQRKKVEKELNDVLLSNTTT